MGLLLVLTACDEPGAEPQPPTPTASQSLAEVQAGADPAGCLAFCEKSTECARAEGRSIPDAASDCGRSCAVGGVHRMAPETVYACASEACGPAFRSCTERALVQHMGTAQIAVFPPTCVGLCSKAARCARDTHAPSPSGTADCVAACQPPGTYADVTAQEVLCIHEPCGPRFEECRRNGGPTEAVESLTAPSP